MKQVYTTARAKYENAWEYIRANREPYDPEAQALDMIALFGTKATRAVIASRSYEVQSFTGWMTPLRRYMFKYAARYKRRAAITERQAVDQAIAEEYTD